MSKYYTTIKSDLNLSTNEGAELTLPKKFEELSSKIIRLCSFSQRTIQNIIYITHGPELHKAKKSLSSFPNPKARMEFLSSFPYSEVDPIISSVFNYSRELFLELYDLRNVLAHENWMTSEEFEGYVLFSKLNEIAKLDMASGKLSHEVETTPSEVHKAIIRYIRSVKIISTEDLQNAIKDANLCAWILMQIGFVLKEVDSDKKAEFRRSFLVFKGTSHLFDKSIISSKEVSVKSSNSKTI